jgi:hypothetical protein
MEAKENEPMTIPQTATSDRGSVSNGTTGVWPADVLTFAAEHHGEHCLQPLWEATQRIFPTAHFIKVSVEEDPELHDNTQIVFHVQVAGLSPDEARAANKQWNQEMVRLYPPLRKFLFCLFLDLRR